jgi:hypothetical protein
MNEYVSNYNSNRKVNKYNNALEKAFIEETPKNEIAGFGSTIKKVDIPKIKADLGNKQSSERIMTNPDDYGNTQEGTIPSHPNTNRNSKQEFLAL